MKRIKIVVNEAKDKIVSLAKKIKKELMLCGIGFDDVYETLKNLITKKAWD